MNLIKIATDFSETPGGRYQKDGPSSGQEFYETILKPEFANVLGGDEVLIVDFDGGYGYPVSFLEEAFGGLSREYGKGKVLAKLQFVSEDEPSLILEVKDYIKNANNKK